MDVCADDPPPEPPADDGFGLDAAVAGQDVNADEEVDPPLPMPKFTVDGVSDAC